MAKQPTITTINSVNDIVATSNTNFANIKESFNNTLSRDGSTPNNMEADIDLNSFDLLNVGLLEATDVTVGGTNITTSLTTSVTNAATSADEASKSAAEAALYEGVWLNDVTSIVNDTSLTYTTGQAGSVSVGDYVRTRKEGFSYQVVASTATDHHLTTAGGVKLKIASNQWYFEHFNLLAYPADITATCQAAIDAATTGRRIMFATSGPYRVTDTLLLKKNNMEIAGPNGGEAVIEYVNAAGGAVFSGDSDKNASLNAYSRCRIEGIRIASVDASTDPSQVVDLTSFSYGYFYVKGQTKRADADFYYGQGNAGTSPYWNTIVIDGVFGGDGAGGTNYTQTALKFAQGVWAGGSNGGNANTIRCQGRAAALKGVLDIQSGTGNMIEVLSGESINDWYVRLNFNANVDNGTSSGSNSQNTFKDTSKVWTTNEYLNDAVKIIGGTGAGQVRIIATNTADTLTIKEPWGIVPDATSTYQIYEGKAHGNQIALSRAEGLASLNPDFIQAHPGTYKNNFAFSEVQSLGSGLFVRDDSGSPDNNWFNGDKLVFTHTFANPGPSANVNAYERVSVFGGVKVPGTYAVEWLKVNLSTSSGSDQCEVRLDAGGTAVGGGDVTLNAQIPSGNSIATALPASTEKVGRDGTNKSLYLNLQTGAAFSATVDVQATYCVSLL